MSTVRPDARTRFFSIARELATAVTAGGRRLRPVHELPANAAREAAHARAARARRCGRPVSPRRHPATVVVTACATARMHVKVLVNAWRLGEENRTACWRIQLRHISSTIAFGIRPARPPAIG